MPEERGRYSLVVLVCVLLITNAYLLYLNLENRNGVLTFAMMDVGQGDALFIESPTGVQLLFDGGPARKIGAPLARLMSPLDRDLDAIVVTNPDADHIAGFLDVLKDYEVGIVLEPGTFNGSKTYENLKQEIQNQKIPNILARKGMRLNIGGGALIDILFPDRDVSYFNSNDGSVVARLTYGDNSIMLTGDATSKTEKIILENNPVQTLNSDILKIGHHGSRTSSSLAFLEEVSPKYAMISSGQGNSYGHPHGDVVRLLEELGVEILRTDELGTIVFSCDRIGPCEIKK